KLTRLDLELSVSKVRDLKPLEHLNGLTHLNLNLVRSAVHDLKPLEQLKGLQHLTLFADAGTTGFEALGALTKLEVLNLSAIGATGRSIETLPASIVDLTI